jgi:RNA polymerase sigma-70 factor, ECF subfamily
MRGWSFVSTTPPDASDELLVWLAREDPTAFAHLYERHVTPIYRYLLARVRDVSDAQDLTAQTFEAALRNIRHFRGEGSFAAWLTVIARNKAVNFYRARREIPLDALHDLPGGMESPEDIVGQKLRLERVLSVLESLKPERAEVVRLRIFGELSTAETAEVMGRSEAAVKMLLNRALQDLRQRLGVREVES